MYSSSWFLTLFASTLPLCAAFRILDIFLIDGIEIIFRVGLALLERSQSELLKLDMEDMTKVIIILLLYCYVHVHVFRDKQKPIDSIVTKICDNLILILIRGDCYPLSGKKHCSLFIFIAFSKRNEITIRGRL